MLVFISSAAIAQEDPTPQALTALVEREEALKAELAEVQRQIEEMRSVIPKPAAVDPVVFDPPVNALTRSRAPLLAWPEVPPKRIGVIAKGTPLRLKAFAGYASDWISDTGYVHVAVDGQEGYVDATFLDREDPELAEMLRQAKKTYDTEFRVYLIGREEEKALIAEERRAAAEAERQERRAAAEAEKQRRAEELRAKYSREDAQRIIDRKIWIGMTSEMALDSWGRPTDVNRTVYSDRIREQWVYASQDAYLYFEDGILVAWQD